tara:strand:- start:2016 stop:3632 length:1617 start_codon:yes stop_codon:yes gene_type:complete
MGLRGIGSARRKEAQDKADLTLEPHPWEVQGLTRPERVIAFLETLPVTKGIGVGEPLKLLPFQTEWIEAVYTEGEDGLRNVRTALQSVARGNGKTVLVAGLCLCHLVGPEAEERGEVYSAAATRDQASIVFAEMEATIIRTPWMEARLNIKRHSKIIEDLEDGSIYKALANDAPAVHGLAASFVACDELAQWKRREMYDVLRTSMGKRLEPLIAVIGTQSPHPENIMSELVDYAKRIASGEISDPSFHGAVYEVLEDDDPWLEENWYKANPALDKFRSLREIQEEAKRAQRMPTFEPAFRNLYLNQRVDAEPKAINPAEWAECRGKVSLKKLEGRPCWAGLDLSSTRDLSALVLYFPDDDGAIIPFFWCPKANLAEKEEHDRVPYRTWAKQKHIEATPGKAIDKRAIAHRLAEIGNLYDVKGIAFDRFGYKDLEKILEVEGVDLPLIEFGQGFVSMGPAINAFETALLNGDLKHGNHPVLRWNASNAVFDTDPAGNRKANKNRSIDRIDGLVALIMAIGLYAKQPEAAEFGGLHFIDA